MPTAMRVHVQEHCFLVGDAGGASLPFDLLDWSSGIAGTMPTALLIDAGIQNGTVTVTATVCDERPPLETAQDWASTDEWDDITEVSVNAPLAMLTIAQLQYPPDTQPAETPTLSPHGPGPYRLRLHASGRDKQHDQIVEHSDVRLHIVAWPGPLTAPLIIKSTSLCSYGLRLSQHQRPPRAPSNETFPGPQEKADRDTLIQQTLQATRRQARRSQD